MDSALAVASVAVLLLDLLLHNHRVNLSCLVIDLSRRFDPNEFRVRPRPTLGKAGKLSVDRLGHSPSVSLL